jgi:hypothetical protein
MGEVGRRGDKGGGMYKLSMGGGRFKWVSEMRSRIGDFEYDRP